MNLKEIKVDLGPHRAASVDRVLCGGSFEDNDYSVCFSSRPAGANWKFNDFSFRLIKHQP